MTLVSMSDYVGLKRSVQLTEVPKIPALYVWYVDYSAGLRDHSETIELLQKRASFEGPPIRPDVRNLNLEVSVGYDQFDDDRSDSLAAILSHTNPLGDWMGGILSYLQRPLYVGITTDLDARVSDHLNDPTGIGNDVKPSLLEVGDLLLGYYELPSELISEIYPDDGDTPDSAGEGDREDPDAQGHSIEQVETDDPLPDRLRLIEYALIRTAMPIFNRK